MDVKEELHRFVENLSVEEAGRVLELMVRRGRNPLLQLEGVVSSDRTDGAASHDSYVYGPVR